MKRYFRRDNLTGQVAEITKGNYDTIKSLNVKTLTVWAEEQVDVAEPKKRKRIQEEVVDTTEAADTTETIETNDETNNNVNE